MRKILLVTSFLVAQVSFCQIQVENKNKQESTTQGLFAKGGSLKLTSLDCYTFDNLIISFDIQPSYFSFDQVVITLTRSTDPNSGFAYSYTFSKEDFARKFQGKKYAYFQLFNEDGLDRKSVMGFTRVQLQMVGSKKDIESSKIYIKVHGGMKTGDYETAYQDGKVITKDKYKYEVLSKFNPIGMTGLFKEPSWGQYPTMPKGDGNCYN